MSSVRAAGSFVLRFSRVRVARAFDVPSALIGLRDDGRRPDPGDELGDTIDVDRLLAELKHVLRVLDVLVVDAEQSAERRRSQDRMSMWVPVYEDVARARRDAARMVREAIERAADQR